MYIKVGNPQHYNDVIIVNLNDIEVNIGLLVMELFFTK